MAARRKVSRMCVICGVIYQGDSISKTCSVECKKARKTQEHYKWVQQRLVHDPGYSTRWYQQQIMHDPEFRKKQYQRQLELHPEFGKKRYQRVLKLHPEFYKKRYRQALKLDPECFAKYRGSLRSRLFFATVHRIITELGPRITDDPK